MIILQFDSDQFQSIVQSAVRNVLSEQTKLESPRPPHDLISIDEAASLVNLAKPTIYGLVSQSKIPCMKQGKRLYFSRQELTAWIKSGRKKTTQDIEEAADNYLSGKGKRG
ncbi:helix-turn-helix domain-containing protein [Chitinophaga varians]|uniref:helix-turn-helix domain-containing protein n=1 Tax=Chitinophaga varians TaxID=2202339 RepID=UPI00165F83CD|nr:helix-turn-helix domain-containing protein [Chitinophaga varians]MBC9912765.1 helix-turn-helix domain-containing protein [Chitinophaga varians]